MIASLDCNILLSQQFKFHPKITDEAATKASNEQMANTLELAVLRDTDPPHLFKD
jgi:hypothetical protein